MKRIKEDNTVGVIQRAISQAKIPILKSTIKETLISHPNYPTFKAICDTFNEWKIENYPLKYDIDEMMELKDPYIVHFKDNGGQIGLVTSIENDFITCFTSYNICRKFKKKEFAESCTGAIILFNPDEGSGEKEYSTKSKNEKISKAIIPLSIFAIFLFITYSLLSHSISDGVIIPKILLAIYLTKFVGIILSLLLILHEFDTHFILTDKLCHLNGATNCNTVLHDKAAKIYGWFGWADAGFIYFTGSLLFLVYAKNETDLFLLALMSVLSVSYPIFSIYYQAFVLRKWCLICLGVQVILVIEFILMLQQISNVAFSVNSFVALIGFFLAVTLIYILLILFKREKISHEIYYHKYLRFKKNPEVLRTLLLNQPKYEIPVSETSLIFGNKNASLRLTVFLSLHCSHCARAFGKINDILKDDENIFINIVLIASDTKILTTLHNYNRNAKHCETLKLLKEWFNNDPFSRTKISEDLCIPEDIHFSALVNEESNRLFKECNVIGTPTVFVNGYKLPRQYEIDDIGLFQRDLIREGNKILK